MNKTLKGKTALVTGAYRRLGKAISLALAAEGVNIVVHYPWQEKETAELTGALSEYNNTAENKIKWWTLKADFSRPQEYRTLVRRATKLAGRLDILINNASIFIADSMENSTFENLRKHIEINSWVPFTLTRDFAGSGRGSVINILDSKIKGQDWEHMSYIMSKHMLSTITQMCALKYAPGVSVNAVAPGLILPPEGKDESYLQKLSKKVPLKRHGSAQDIASAVIYLLKNDFVTGQVLFIDGGRHIGK